jgi:hypothetical protein
MTSNFTMNSHATHRRRGKRLILRMPAVPATAGLLAAGLCACGANGPPSAPNAAFGANVEHVSLTAVEQETDALYRDHPGVSSFTVQDVQYTASSRAAVLRACAGSDAARAAAGAGAASQTVESQRLLACAPLIFFYYSYGREVSVPDSIALAHELYSYAVTNIAGPMNAAAALGELLRSWGLPVAGQHTAPSAPATNPAVAALITKARRAILAQHGVHVTVTGRNSGSSTAAEQIVADMGATTGTESLAAGEASASIRVTPTAAYLAGNSAGLTTLIGLPASAAKKVGAHWAELKAGTREYQDLAKEDTISALPASILPSAADSVRLRTSVVAGRPAYVLSWQVISAGTSTVSEELTLAATASPLPVSETSSSQGDVQTAAFTRWGTTFTVPAPASAISYSRVTGN